MADQRYRPEDRLRSKAEFDRVLQHKCSVRSQHIILYGCENELGRPRLGRIVSKRWGNAVVRNRYRRWFREAFRRMKGELPQVDLVVIPAQALGMTYEVIKAEMLALSVQLKAKLLRNIINPD